MPRIMAGTAARLTAAANQELENMWGNGAQAHSATKLKNAISPVKPGLSQWAKLGSNSRLAPR